MRDQLRDSYKREEERIEDILRRLRVRNRSFVAGEIASFLGILFFIVLVTLSGSSVVKIIEGVGAALMFFAYVIIRRKDVKNSERIAELERLRKAHQHEVQYLNGDFSSFDDGERYVNPHHSFTYDLDIFGREGLYQRLNRTVTSGGADRLAYYLGSVNAHKSIDEINDYRKAIHGLGDDSLTHWRMEFIANGVDSKIDTNVILKTLPKLKAIDIPKIYSGKVMIAVAWALSIGLIASIIAAIYHFVNPLLPIFWLIFNFFFVSVIAGKKLNEMLAVGNSLKGQMDPLMHLISMVSKLNIDEESLDTEILKHEARVLQSAETSFDSLTNIVETLILRGSDIYKLFADSLGLRGILLVCKFYHWREEASDNISEWLAAIAEIDAIVSMAQYDNLSQIESNVTIQDSNKVVFNAKGLYHPFLGEKAVRNDFNIEDRNFYIVTGANMAGKSTFLRAVGINYVLAMNGMPVFADSLTVSRFNLFTSMRTSDDLAHGISYFNAELLRLKQLIQNLTPNSYLLTPNSSTLIILDEILKGTNSADKLNGSRMFLRAMMDKPVTGIIATHDLELSKMDEESPRFHNFCFEIKLGTDVTYSYKITTGVARNQNATYLLKKMLNDKS